MDRLNVLSLLGLSLRGGRLAIGEEPAEAAARARDARVLLLASDAAEGTRRRCEHFARAGDCLWLRLPFTKEELGRALGRTSVAIAAVTDVGLADALLRRLAELDPAAYAEASERMALKARRAAERKAEQAAHEKNVRRGKRRAKEAPVPAEKRPAAGSGTAADRRKAEQAAHEKNVRRGKRRAKEAPVPAEKRPAAGSGTAADRRKAAGERPRRASAPHRPRPPKDARPKPRAQTRFAHSRPVKKGKGSFRRKDS